MTNKVNVFKNKSKFSKSIYQKCKNIFNNYGYILTSSYEHDAILNLVIGGDGTFLNAVHQSEFSDIPFIGINTGHLGFYQEVETNMIESFIRSFDQKDYRVEDLSVLESHLAGKKINSINEVVIKSNRNQIVRLKVFIDGNFIEYYSGDGLIISTPHGSTAYNLSAGGAILHQSLNGFQLTPIAPIYSNMNKALRSPVVLPNDATIDISISKRDNFHTVFIFDGREYSAKDYKIRINVSDTKIKKLILNRNHYWNNIKNKLMWLVNIYILIDFSYNVPRYRSSGYSSSILAVFDY